MKGITLGTCYYPEHWDRSLWEDDLRRMKEHGLSIIRIAEFAWNLFEPAEGQYDFRFFDEFLDLAEKHGLQVIFCTPTATPPAWLTTKYPEVLNADIDGNLYRHGLRRHYNLNSKTYHRIITALVEHMAEHYCPRTCIIGWQIDNEINCEISEYHSDADHEAFRDYMRDKFGTLQNLNEKMGTVFWNQTYTDWNEIRLSSKTTSNTYNPHMLLEEKRFISNSVLMFIKLQADIIKKYRRNEQFITTNGIFGFVDYHELTEQSLDFLTYDSYPNFAFGLDANPKEENSMRDRGSSFSLTRTRSASKAFGIMEQQSGPGGWTSRMAQPSPKPGQMRLWTMQDIAHGADYVGYFRWRTCWIGTEIYWHGLNDYSNEPNRRLKELKDISLEVENLQEIAGADYVAKVALVRDYDNEWDGSNDIWHGPLDRISYDGWFKALQRQHVAFDIVYLKDETEMEELDNYEFLIYPHPTIMTQKRGNLLKHYVELGGKLLVGSRSGYKDLYGRCPMQTMPGVFSELCGVKVSDFTFLGPDDAEEFAMIGSNKIPAPIFNDIMEPIGDATVLARFDGNYYSGSPALVAKKHNNGTAYYFGAAFSEETAKGLMKLLEIEESRMEWLHLPEQIEMAVRRKDSMEYIFLLNYKEECIVKLDCELVDLLSGKVLSGDVNVPKYGVLILKKAGIC